MDGLQYHGTGASQQLAASREYLQNACAGPSTRSPLLTEVERAERLVSVAKDYRDRLRYVIGHLDGSDREEKQNVNELGVPVLGHLDRLQNANDAMENTLKTLATEISRLERLLVGTQPEVRRE